MTATVALTRGRDFWGVLHRGAYRGHTITLQRSRTTTVWNIWVDGESYSLPGCGSKARALAHALDIIDHHEGDNHP
jgi:hypothetical protein